MTKDARRIWSPMRPSGAARSDRWGSILEIFQENDLTYMIFLRLHQGYSVKTNVANDDYYT